MAASKIYHNGQWYYLNPTGVGGGTSSPYTEPILADWTWHQQGQATIDDTGIGLLVKAEGFAEPNGVVNRLVYKMLPATPYVIECAFIPMPGHTVITAVAPYGTGGPYGYVQAGMGWFNSVDKKHIAIRGLQNSNLELTHWNLNTFQAMISTFNYEKGVPIWVRFADDGVTRTIYFSLDQGQCWQKFYATTHADFTAPDSIAFGVDSEGKPAYNAIRLLHYKQV